MFRNKSLTVLEKLPNRFTFICCPASHVTYIQKINTLSFTQGGFQALRHVSTTFLQTIPKFIKYFVISLNNK
jgi:hypothetical protein